MSGLLTVVIEILQPSFQLLRFELTTGLCPRLSLSLLGGYCVLWLVWLHHRPQAAQLRPCSVGPAAWAGEHDDSGEMLRDGERVSDVCLVQSLGLTHGLQQLMMGCWDGDVTQDTDGGTGAVRRVQSA